MYIYIYAYVCVSNVYLVDIHPYVMEFHCTPEHQIVKMTLIKDKPYKSAEVTTLQNADGYVPGNYFVR